MNNVARGQAIAAGDPGVSGCAATKRFTFAFEFGTGRAMDRAVDATTAEQRSIGGVNDGIDVEPGNVANGDRKARAMRLLLEHRART